MSNSSKPTSFDKTTIEYSLELKDLSKYFRRQTLRSGYTTIKSSLLRWAFAAKVAEHELTRAIENLTLRIPKGASVGIIGRNGSGKSTLLKLISGIYKPDKGSVQLHGKVAALIELGAGFHPDFTGRENVYLGGVMHGLTKAQVKERFEQIVEFAELEKVIDDPVRTYSSGMFMRLGFSLAIHTDPDILIVDEVLAVGDAAFVAKCKERITELRKQGKTLLLVTHDLDSVERWCDEAVWLHAGHVKDRGDPRRVIDHYRQFIEQSEEFNLSKAAAVAADEQSFAEPTQEVDSARWGSREIEITAARLLASDGQPRLLFHTDEPMHIEISYRVNEGIKDPVFGVGISRSDGLLVHGSNTEIDRVVLPQLKITGVFCYQIKRLALAEGNYSLDVAVHRVDGYPFDYHKSLVKFAVRSAHKHVGVCSPEHTWAFDGQTLCSSIGDA